MHYGFTIGGSFGECAICSGNFMMEIILGQKHTSFEFDGDTFACHKRCYNEFAPKPISEWPDKSPLKGSIVFTGDTPKESEDS